MDHGMNYLPLRSTHSQLGPMPPLCLLLAVFYQHQQWTILCLCLVRFANFQTELGITFTGGKDHKDNYLDEILSYDPASDTWTAEGRMKTPRAYHSVMSLSDISGLC